MKSATYELERIINNALEGKAPTREECIFMLDFPETSLEAGLIRATADNISRTRFMNEAIILGQIGIEIDSCPGGCKFCSFAEGHTKFTASSMSDSDLLAAAKSFNSGNDIFAIFLMAMHNFNFDRLLHSINLIKDNLENCPNLVVNIGDITKEQAQELKNSGITGAYHVCRLREGIDTALAPEQRINSIKAIKETGLDWYYCCEPIGPEHSSAELVEQLFLGIEYGCFQHATMRRIYLPDSPLADCGQITNLRLGQITAVVALASIACTDTRNIAVHEPNLIGLSSGANVVYAECGANPRDTTAETQNNRGMDISNCKTMLYDAGFTKLLLSGNRRKPLSEAYTERNI